MTDNPYGLDFFSKVTNIHFGGPGILAIHIEAGQTSDHDPDVSVTISGTLLTKVEKRVRTDIPAHDIPNSVIFVWMDGATPFPDATNFGNLVVPAPPVGYGDQFSLLIDISSRGSGPPSLFGLTLASPVGVYADFASAVAYADEWNTEFASDIAGGATCTFFNPTPGSGDTTVPLGTLRAAEIDLAPTHVPAQDSIAFTGDYTLKLGPKLQTTTVTISIDPDTFPAHATLDAAFDSSGDFGGGIGTYLIQTGVVSGHDRCNVTSPS